MSNRYYEAMNKLTPEEHKKIVDLINGLKIKHDDAWSDVFNAGVDACLKIISDTIETEGEKS